MGRAHRSVHERGPDGGDDPAPQAGRSAADPHRPRSRLSLRSLTGLRSAGGRIVLLCLGAAASGILVFQLLQDQIQRLFRSVLSIQQTCWTGSGPFYACTPYGPGDRMLGSVLALVGFVVLVWVLRRLARWALRPVAAMTDTVRHLGPQNLGQRVRLDGPRDELRVLADELDEMIDRMVVGLEGQRRFASNASHELRTPLAVQRTLVEVAMVTGKDDPDLNRLAEQLLVVNERNERLIEGLLVLAESDRGLPGVVPVRLDVLVDKVLDSYGELAAEHEVTLHRGVVERSVQADPVLLERMVSNLVHNAIKYNEPGGTVDVVVAREPALSVHNSGVPVPAESVSALFEPFRRLTAERVHQRDGAGLGLSIVRSICSAHGGTVHARPGERGGLRVEISLP